jgi:hypothetical protein
MIVRHRQATIDESRLEVCIKRDKNMAMSFVRYNTRSHTGAILLLFQLHILF